MGKRRERYVRWDKSGVHLQGTRSSLVRGRTWLTICADVRKYLVHHGVHPADRALIIKSLEFTTRTEHRRLCDEALNRVTIPGRPARTGYGRNKIEKGRLGA